MIENIVHTRICFKIVLAIVKNPSTFLNWSKTHIQNFRFEHLTKDLRVLYIKTYYTKIILYLVASELPER